MVTFTFVFTYIPTDEQTQTVNDRHRPNNLPTGLQIHACLQTRIHGYSFVGWLAFLLVFVRVRDTCILTNWHCSHFYEAVLLHVHAWLVNIVSHYHGLQICVFHRCVHARHSPDTSNFFDYLDYLCATFLKCMECKIHDANSPLFHSCYRSFPRQMEVSISNSLRIPCRLQL